MTQKTSSAMRAKTKRKAALESASESEEDLPAKPKTAKKAKSTAHQVPPTSSTSVVGGKSKSKTKHLSTMETTATTTVVSEKRKRRDYSKSDSEEESGDDEKCTDPVGHLLEFSAQKAMALLAQICDKLSIKWQGADIQPLNSIWPKMASSFMRKQHPEFRLTFSTYESFNWQLGRFLAAMIYTKCDLAPKFLPGGVYIWRHDWIPKKGSDMMEFPKCFHGMDMVVKPRSVEFSATSEAGRRAIGEQGAMVEKNKYGRSVAVIRYDSNVVCFKDATHNGFPNPHASGSCAMVFSDAGKAMSAMKHDIQWTKAIYPNVDPNKVEERIFIVGNCLCNYALEGSSPGRQLCKMVPFKMNGVDDIPLEVVKTRKDMAAHKEFGHTMVYLCCNPSSQSNSKSAAAAAQSASNVGHQLPKSCAWKLSAIDLRYAFIFALQLYTEALGSKASGPKLTEFKWSPSFAFKSEVIQPAIVQDTDILF